MLLASYGIGVSVVTWGWSLWVGIGVGLGLCVVFALLLGIPTLKLRAEYFAITTIAAAEILRFVARSTSSTDITGGPYGLQAVSGDFIRLNPFPAGQRYGFGQFSYTSTQLWTMTVAWALVALSVAFVALLMSSPWGRVIRSIREDEDVASSVGKNVFSYKLQALVIGGVIGGLAGVMITLGNSTVNAASFHPLVTFFAYACLILGGVGTRLGPVVGAMLFWFVFSGSQSLLAGFTAEGWLPTFLQGSEARGALAAALIGVLIVTLTAFRAQGIFGKREEMVFGG
jgi:branched-chain amino acid transport system permease protein